jgi:hypothetical protein
MTALARIVQRPSGGGLEPLVPPRISLGASVVGAWNNELLSLPSDSSRWGRRQSWALLA